MKQTAIKLSILSLIAIGAGNCIAQIPNTSFENWTDMGSYNNPVDWQCLNDYTDEISIYTCTKGTPGISGNAYIKLTSKTLTASATLNAIAVCGELNVTTGQPVSGFPFTDRPEMLTGSWQHMIFGSTQGYIDVFLTRWDGSLQTSVPVASLHHELFDMAMSWQTFELPLEYFDDGNPDSCMIVLSASGSVPTNMDYLWVDNLAFEGSAGMGNYSTYAQTISGFPNPTSGNVTLNTEALQTENVQCIVSAQNGMIVRNEKLVITSGRLNLNLAELTPGNYLVQLLYSGRKEMIRIVVQ